MLNIIGHNVFLYQFAAFFACNNNMGEFSFFRCHSADIHQAGIGRNRPCAAAHQFHAVVIGRVMAGSYHNTTVGI